MKMAFGAGGFRCIMFKFFSCRYLDNKVFVSLANGEVIVYQREAGNLECGAMRTFSSPFIYFFAC